MSGDKLKIFRVDDFGPITKLYPTIERVTNPDTIIVVVDDDLVYHNEMLEDQVKNQFKFDRSIVGYDGIDCWQSIFNDVRDHFITAHRLNIKVKVLQHYKSISYKRSFIESDFKAFMDEYYEWNDDLLMAAYMGSKDIKRIFTYNEKYTPNYTTIDEWRTGNAAITFPLLRHTSHEGEEGCNDNADGTLGVAEVQVLPQQEGRGRGLVDAKCPALHLASLGGLDFKTSKFG